LLLKAEDGDGDDAGVGVGVGDVDDWTTSG
jgi:hypothetical protein